jgi:hypothetical protein
MFAMAAALRDERRMMIHFALPVLGILLWWINNDEEG